MTQPLQAIIGYTYECKVVKMNFRFSSMVERQIQRIMAGLYWSLPQCWKL